MRLLFKALCFLSVSSIFCNEPLTYTSVGIGPLPLPAFTVSIGHRSAILPKMMIDNGVTVSSFLVRDYFVGGYTNSLFNFGSSPFYAGFGVTLGGLLGKDLPHASAIGAPNMILGRSLNSQTEKGFIQITTNYPVFSANDHSFDAFPFVTIKYGVGF